MSNFFLKRTGGRIAYEDHGGSGQLIILAPPIGALRSVYRFLTPILLDCGLHVVSFDLRGHGQSDPEWADVSVQAIGADTVALVKEIGTGPAVSVGIRRPDFSAR